LLVLFCYNAFMAVYTEILRISSVPKATVEFTASAESALRNSGIRDGNLTAFCRHTSCSLVIMENADPSARYDLERFIDRLVPENDPNYTHTLEGPDDMPSHIKMALTRTSETVPIHEGRLMLGTWQGLYLWEHRAVPHTREIVLTIQGE
jgi:secondary thiamine-phosphate synthase enzyme